MTPFVISSGALLRSVFKLFKLGRLESLTGASHQAGQLWSVKGWLKDEWKVQGWKLTTTPASHLSWSFNLNFKSFVRTIVMTSDVSGYESSGSDGQRLFTHFPHSHIRTFHNSLVSAIFSNILGVSRPPPSSPPVKAIITICQALQSAADATYKGLFIYCASQIWWFIDRHFVSPEITSVWLMLWLWATNTS